MHTHIINTLVYNSGKQEAMFPLSLTLAIWVLNQKT